jgi:tetrahedral aminopeptidase
MRKESLQFLKKLVTTPSPSGCEAEAQKVCKAYAQPYADKIHKDVHGNQYHVLNPDGKLRVMLAGHVDEIGMMVNLIDDKGFLRVVPVGGVDTAVLGAQRVTVHGEKGPVPGVMGRKAIHLTPAEDRNKALQIHEMWVDIGAKDKKDAQSVVAVGDPITIEAGFQELRDGKVVARGFDDRIGAFVVLETLRLLQGKKHACAVFAVTTVQEELGLRGAKTSAYHVDPHVGIAVDVGFATDHPKGDSERYGEGFINQGPILHRGPNINPVVERQLAEVAKKKKIPYQMGAEPRATGTDANAIQVNRAGVAAGLVSIPNRYMHTPVELISLKDAENAALLLAEWILSLKKDTTFIP